MKHQEFVPGARILSLSCSRMMNCVNVNLRPANVQTNINISIIFQIIVFDNILKTICVINMSL